jgi:hypothetical protein
VGGVVHTGSSREERKNRRYRQDAANAVNAQQKTHRFHDLSYRGEDVTELMLAGTREPVKR